MRRRQKRAKNGILTFALISISSILCVFFLSQFDSFISESYEVGAYEKKIQELSSANEKLSVDSLETSMLERIEKIAKDSNFEKPEKVHYIKIITGGMATTKVGPTGSELASSLEAKE